MDARKVENWMIIKDVSELRVGDKVAWIFYGHELTDGTYATITGIKNSICAISNWSDQTIDSTGTFSNSCLYDGSIPTKEGILRAAKRIPKTKLSLKIYKNRIIEERDDHIIVEV